MLGNKLKMARELVGLTMYQLSKKSGIAQSSISEIEGGQNKNPSFVTIAKLADVLGVSLDVLAERLPPSPKPGRPPRAARPKPAGVP